MVGHAVLSDEEIDRIVPALEPVSEDFPAEWAVWKDRERIRKELRASAQAAQRDALQPVVVLQEKADMYADDFVPSADSVTAPAATVIKKGADRQWISERLGHLPDGIYSLYLAPPTQAADSVLEGAARLLESQHTWLTNVAAANLVRSLAARKQGENHDQ